MQRGDDAAMTPIFAGVARPQMEPPGVASMRGPSALRRRTLTRNHSHSYFTMFSLLPAELRFAVWRAAFEPRILRVNLHTRNSTVRSNSQLEILPVVTPSPGLARVTQPLRNLMSSCREARRELRAFLSDSLPIYYLRQQRNVPVPYSPELDLICYQELSDIILQDTHYTRDPNVPPRSSPVKSIAFDAEFIAHHLRTELATRSPYQSMGCFLEMMPSVRRIYIVDPDVHSLRDGYSFRVLAGRYGKMISLHQPPTSNPNVICPHEFEDLVETGQAFCDVLRNRHWQASKLKDQEIAVFVLSRSRTGRMAAQLYE